jgi:surface antigen
LLGWCGRREVLEAETKARRALEAGKGVSWSGDDGMRMGRCVERACEVALE